MAQSAGFETAGRVKVRGGDNPVKWIRERSKVS